MIRSLEYEYEFSAPSVSFGKLDHKEEYYHSICETRRASRVFAIKSLIKQVWAGWTLKRIGSTRKLCRLASIRAKL